MIAIQMLFDIFAIGILNVMKIMPRYQVFVGLKPGVCCKFLSMPFALWDFGVKISKV